MKHDLYELVLFYTIKGIKPNYTELDRQYHCDPRTVKKYYEAGKNELEKIKARKTTKRVSKLGPYRALIDEKLELGCTAIAIINIF